MEPWPRPEPPPRRRVVRRDPTERFDGGEFLAGFALLAVSLLLSVPGWINVVSSDLHRDGPPMTVVFLGTPVLASLTVLLLALTTVTRLSPPAVGACGGLGALVLAYVPALLNG